MGAEKTEITAEESLKLARAEIIDTQTVFLTHTIKICREVLDEVPPDEKFKRFMLFMIEADESNFNYLSKKIEKMITANTDTKLIDILQLYARVNVAKTIIGAGLIKAVEHYQKDFPETILKWFQHGAMEVLSEMEKSMTGVVVRIDDNGKISGVIKDISHLTK